MSTRSRIIIAVVAVVIIAAGAWFWSTRGKESTDDAQVEAHVTPIASRVGGTVQAAAVADNQRVTAGAVLVQIDPRDFQLAVEKARAELADAEAAAAASQANVPIVTATASGGISTARGGIAQAQAGITESEQAVLGARSREATAQARVREAEANATKAAKDVERLKPLLDKDEISQQQYDSAVAAANVARATVDSAVAQEREAQAGIQAAESRVKQAQATREQASAQLQTADTAPQQVAATKARAAAAAARVMQLRAAVKQAELNLEYATVKAPTGGVVSRKTVEPGQVIQPGQPLMTIVSLDPVWITANFKETQLEDMRPGQRVTVKVDAYGGTTLTGKIESIAAATGARFSLLPPENATGNFVKVVQRVPVKIVLDEGQDAQRVLRPGMSVTPTVHTQ
ncbi:MAG TPA: HlyD family secretion protein [Vicinamibacterales bacterium]|jgi:membrane fusion protein (multidrug efflux system)|nr:HlyD family secretion protein [Vicinamibacterales bacterium]